MPTRTDCATRLRASALSERMPWRKAWASREITRSASRAVFCICCAPTARKTGTCACRATSWSQGLQSFWALIPRQRMQPSVDCLAIIACATACLTARSICMTAACTRRRCTLRKSWCCWTDCAPLWMRATCTHLSETRSARAACSTPPCKKRRSTLPLTAVL